jgi:hypothetical protein
LIGIALAAQVAKLQAHPWIHFQSIVVSGKEIPVEGGKRTGIFFGCFTHGCTNLSGLRDLCEVLMKTENFGLQFDITSGRAYFQYDFFGKKGMVNSTFYLIHRRIPKQERFFE